MTHLSIFDFINPPYPLTKRGIGLFHARSLSDVYNELVGCCLLLKAACVSAVASC